MTPEGKVKAACRRTLRRIGVFVLPINAQGIGSAGIPDDLVIWRGQTAFIEYKAQVNRATPAALRRSGPTPLQRRVIARLREQWIWTFVLDATTWKSFCDTVLAAGLLVCDETEPYVWVESAGGAGI